MGEDSRFVELVWLLVVRDGVVVNEECVCDDSDDKEPFEVMWLPTDDETLVDEAEMKSKFKWKKTMHE